MLLFYYTSRLSLRRSAPNLCRRVSLRCSGPRNLTAARDLGDLSENADYDAARDEQGQAESRIAEIEDILQNAEIIATKKSDKVMVGSKVELKNGSKNVVYQIVGPVEADPMDGKVSNESPIGQALVGKAVGESIEIKTSKMTTKYTILKIS